MNRALTQLLRPIQRKLANMIARGVVKLVTDTTKMQELQISVLKDEIRERCEHFQPYGFTAFPLADAECVVVFPNGQREHPLVVVVSDRRYRPQGMARGESVLHNHVGDYVWIKADGTIKVKASTKVLVDAPAAEFTGNVTITGNLTVNGGTGVSAPNGDVVAGTVHLKTHTHTDPQGGTVGAPT